MTTGTLYLIPVALGDVQWNHFLPASSRDIACRLVHFAVENAKTARAELKRLGHPMPLRDLQINDIPQKPSNEQLTQLLAPLFTGHDLGVMSEAGCPGIADPGAVLVSAAHQRDIRVRPLVGPSSILLALMGSGLNGQNFTFHGYLPAHEPQRSQVILKLENESRQAGQSQIFIETPYRNEAIFNALLQTCHPTSLLCIARDLTLRDELIVTKSIASWRSSPAPLLHHRPTVFILSAA